jgi:hypothetical protein
VKVRDLDSHIAEESIEDESSLCNQTFPIFATVGEVSIGVHTCGISAKGGWGQSDLKAARPP